MPKTLTVKTGNVSVGTDSIGIPISFSRDACPLSKAEEFFCGRRLKIRLTRGTAAAGQKEIPGTVGNNASIESQVEVKALGVKQKTFGARLNIMLDDVPHEQICEFANHECTLEIMENRAIPKAKKDPLPGQGTLPTSTVKSGDGKPTSLGESVKKVVGKAAKKASRKKPVAKSAAKKAAPKKSKRAEAASRKKSREAAAKKKASAKK